MPIFKHNPILQAENMMKEKAASILFVAMIFLCALACNAEIWNITSFAQIIYLVVKYFCLYSALFFIFLRLGKLSWLGIVVFYFIAFGLAYFYYSYKRTLSYDVLAAMLEANAFEIESFLSPMLILTVLASFLCAFMHIYIINYIKINNKKILYLFLYYQECSS